MGPYEDLTRISETGCRSVVITYQRVRVRVTASTVHGDFNITAEI